MQEKEIEEIIAEAERLIDEKVRECKEEIEQEEICRLIRQILL